jgi:hypothetical protein
MRAFIIFVLSLFLVLTGCNTEKLSSENTEWKVSAMFKSGAYTMIGEKDRLGFIYDDSEVTRFYPNKKQKYMWHFWGEPDELIGKVKIIGTSKETGREITVLEAGGLAGPNNGADAHMPSTMSLPTSGLWRLNAYIGEKYFGSVVMKVYQLLTTKVASL